MPAVPSRWPISTSSWRRGCSPPPASTGSTRADGLFEHVRLSFDALVTRTAAPESPEPLCFPPVVPREQLETSGYLGSFPHLAGTVFAFEGDEKEAAAQHDAGLAPRGLERLSDDERDGAHPGRLLPAVPGDRRPRPAPRGRPHARHRRRVRLPPRAVQRPGADADLPHARDRAHRRRRDRGGVAHRLARPAPRSCCAGWASSSSSTSPTTRSSAASGRLLAAQQREQELKWELLAPVAGDTPHRDRVLQLPPGSHGPHLRDHHRRRRARPHRVHGLRRGAGHAWPCSPRTDWTSTTGRRRSGRRWSSTDGDDVHGRGVAVGP